MNLVNLLIVFAVIVVLIRIKQPLVVALAAATLATILLFRIPAFDAVKYMWRGATTWTTIQTLLVFYTITFLQRMMEKRKNLTAADSALNGLFHNRRVNVAAAPFIIGMLPAVSAVLLCGPIVRGSAKDALSVEEQSACTSYFRHISECFLPTYASIFVALTLTNGRVGPSDFVLVMLPLVAILFISGWVVYLRRIPREGAVIPEGTKKDFFKLLCTSIWQIVLSIVLIMAFNVPVYIATGIVIVINFFVNKFTFREIVPFFASSFEKKMMFGTWMTMIFKEVLLSTGVISELPDYFAKLPVPTFLIFMLLFFCSTLVATNNAIVPICVPMIVATIPEGQSCLALFAVSMFSSYLAMQVTPVHICLSVCAEDFKVDLSEIIKRGIPMVAIAAVAAAVYYLILSAIGF